MFEYFETELERAGYFYPPENKTPAMITNLGNALVNDQCAEQVARTFRGAIKALMLGRRKACVIRGD